MTTGRATATSNGVLLGHEAAGGVLEFLGVPYAAPPVGELRWAPPQTPDSWAGDYVAATPAAPAPQPDRPVGHRYHGALPGASEDCLRLNIWSPSLSGARPVVVWLHGGGWTLGGASAPIFDGASLAQALDAVVVTVGYRLGTLGWLYEAQTGGNFGFLDQAAALRWVGENAAAFGGDPTRVIAAGESAGAASVLHLLSSPAGEGLFSRALALSPPLGDAAYPAEVGERWSAALGGAAALRGLTAEEVVTAHEHQLMSDGFRGTRGGALPIVGGQGLVDPLSAPTAQPGVDVLIGSNADEATFFFRQPGRVLEFADDDALAAVVARQPGITDPAGTIARYRAALQTDDRNELLVRIAGDAIFHDPIEAWSVARVAGGSKVHRYRLGHRSPQPGLGAVHSVGVPLLWGSYESVDAGRWVSGGPGAEAASSALRAAVRGFVHDGTPGWSQSVVQPLGGELPASQTSAR